MSERDLPGLWDAAWEILEEGAREARSPARLVTLATIGAHGPEARTLALREADRAEARIDLHTDAGTFKVAELRADPRASLLVWHPGRQIQLRLRCLGRVLTDGPKVDASWNVVPSQQRWNYGAEPPPGRPIPAPDAYARREDKAGFAIIELSLHVMDLVDLSEPHARARFARDGDFDGAWASP